MGEEQTCGDFSRAQAKFMFNLCPWEELLTRTGLQDAKSYNTDAIQLLSAANANYNIDESSSSGEELEEELNARPKLTASLTPFGGVRTRLHRANVQRYDGAGGMSLRHWLDLFQRVHAGAPDNFLIAEATSKISHTDTMMRILALDEKRDTTWAQWRSAVLGTEATTNPY